MLFQCGKIFAGVLCGLKQISLRVSAMSHFMLASINLTGGWRLGALWHTPVIPAFLRWNQEDLQFKVILCYTGSKPKWPT